MIDRAVADEFAAAWLAAWNAHDLDEILEHYADDVVFHSPRIRTVTGRDVDSVQGTDELRSYWSAALASAPDLRFELDRVLVGSDALTILYRNHRGQHVAETFVLRDGRVVQSIATYA